MPMPSFYDPYFYNGQTLWGAAAMNSRLARLGGLDAYTDNLIREVTIATKNRIVRDLIGGIEERQPRQAANDIKTRRRTSS